MQPNANNNVMDNTPQTTPMNPDNGVVFKDKPKKNKGMIVGIVILALLAAGGIGFGVWAYLSGNQKEAKLNEQISDLQTQLAEQPEIDETIVDVDTDSDINTADYIYVGEWGLKIKTPEELKVINYSVTESNYGSHLAVSGAKNLNDGKIPESANLEKAFAGAIVKSSSEDGFYPYGELIYTDDAGNKYYYEGPQADPELPENELASWRECQAIIQEMLSNPDNYSAI